MWQCGRVSQITIPHHRSELQCVAECFSVLQCVAVSPRMQSIRLYDYEIMCCSVLQCVAVCCSVLQCVAVCCSVS